ncbi:MAG: energy-coupling factor ABC transporter ATP-binding protein, partial [Chloroflexota bacterium]|nr:energy-coupling factor ABC transporter ATP-binding protein [Chloroflexota bacterium]
MIRLDRVTYRYPGASRAALRDVDLTLADGEVVGLMGANDAGKSTLCLVVAGLAPRVVGGALSGSVLLDGSDAGPMPMHEVATHVAAAFQDPETQRSGIAGTVYEEVAFGPSNLGVPLSEVVERTESALDALAIAELAHRHPGHLSGGQQQLVAMAGLLAMRPRHVVLDEPTARLDARGILLVADAVTRLAAAGVAVLMAEHRSDLVQATCSRVLVLDSGTVAIDGASRDVLADERLAGLGVAAPAQIRLSGKASGVGVPIPPEAVAAATLHGAW